MSTWADFRSIAYLMPIVGAATAAVWLASRGLGASTEGATAFTAAGSLGVALWLESMRREGRLSFLRRETFHSWGPVTALPAETDLQAVLLNEEWINRVALDFANTISRAKQFQAIVWLASSYPAAFYVYPLHRHIENALGRRIQALFIDAWSAERDDMTPVTNLSERDEILLVEIRPSAGNTVSELNARIESRTTANVSGFLTLFESESEPISVMQ